MDWWELMGAWDFSSQWGYYFKRGKTRVLVVYWPTNPHQCLVSSPWFMSSYCPGYIHGVLIMSWFAHHIPSFVPFFLAKLRVQLRNFPMELPDCSLRTGSHGSFSSQTAKSSEGNHLENGSTILSHTGHTQMDEPSFSKLSLILTQDLGDSPEGSAQRLRHLRNGSCSDLGQWATTIHWRYNWQLERYHLVV